MLTLVAREQGPPVRRHRRRGCRRWGSRSGGSRAGVGRGDLLARRPGGDALAPQPNEAGGVLVAEGVGRLVGGQTVVVEAHRAATPDHEALARLAPQADLAGHVGLRFDEERIECLLERREPEPVVDQLGPTGLQAGLLVVQVTFQREVLEVAMGQQQCQCARTFVGLPALDAHTTVLHHVQTAESVHAGHLVELGDEHIGIEQPAIEGHRHPGLEAHHDLDGLGSRLPGHGVDVLGRLVPGVLDDPALDGLAPQVLVDRVGLLLRHRQGDAPGGRVLDAVGAGQAPHPGRGQDLEVGGEGAGADLEADLVVPLARAAVGHGVGVVAPGLGHQMADDDRPGQGRDQRILPLVLGVGDQRGHAEVLGHLAPGVDHGGLDGPGGQCPLPDGVPVRLVGVRVLAHVDGDGDDLCALVLDEPTDGYGRIQPSAVSQDHSFCHDYPLFFELFESTWDARSVPLCV